ncbi:MAG: hypothetical protein U1E11_11935, partial [Dethiobacteria bacterium]|nr:hypothetical protein [Dethiobacteria bacterium]
MKNFYRVALMIVAVLLVSTVPLAGLLPYAELTGKVCSAYSFEMDQDFSNSGGVVNRFIGISDPWSGGYLYEDLTVVGSASITDSFSMDNFGSGSNEDIFNFGADDNLGFGTGDLYNFGGDDKPASKSGASSLFETDGKPDSGNKDIFY